MKFTRFLAAGFVSLVFVSSAYAQNRYYLPHVANGDYGDGSFRMTFILFNNSDAGTSALLELTSDAGLPLTVTITGLGTGSQFTIPLSAGATQILQTDGLGNMVAGAAVVTSATDIGVSAIFTIYDKNGHYVTESGVGSSAPLTAFVLPVDTTGLFNTGLALFNFGGVDASITLILRGTGGQQIATTPMMLRSHGHIAKFISGTAQLFPAATNVQGTLLVQSTVPIAAMVLRQNLTPLSYTSLPVVSTTSTKQTLNLAHAANGTYTGGSFKTSFLIFNISASPANVTLALTQDNGTPLSVTVPGYGTRSSFPFNNLAAGASIFLQTDGSGALSVGAATITSNVPIGASGVFTVFNTQGAFQTEAGVGDSPVLTSLTLPVDITDTVDTGVAFFGPAGATLTFQLRSESGKLVGSRATRNLDAKGHLAEFASQIFGTRNFRGSVGITATSGVAALALRQHSSPPVLSYTTLPVASGAAFIPVPASSIVLAVASSILPGIEQQLNQFVTDLGMEGYRVVVHSITEETPPDLKRAIKNYYDSLSPKLEGIIFLGMGSDNIPTATYEWNNPPGSVFKGLSMQYYMDLDGTFSFKGGPVINEIDSHTGNVEIEIWTSILPFYVSYTSTVAYINDYLTKNHNYRSGKLTVQRGFVNPVIGSRITTEALYNYQYQIIRNEYYEKLTQRGNFFVGIDNNLGNITRFPTSRVSYEQEMLTDKYDVASVGAHGSAVAFGDLTPDDDETWGSMRVDITYARTRPIKPVFILEHSCNVAAIGAYPNLATEFLYNRDNNVLAFAGATAEQGGMGVTAMGTAASFEADLLTSGQAIGIAHFAPMKLPYLGTYAAFREYFAAQQILLGDGTLRLQEFMRTVP